MNERKTFERWKTTEVITEDTFDYTKLKYRENGKYHFYLRFIKEHFTPCDECQKQLYDLITNADYLLLGNKDYEPPIELSRSWDIDDNSWAEIERRKPTKEDFQNIYGSKWEKEWNAWLKR
jgi:hypothetical protein